MTLLSLEVQWQKTKLQMNAGNIRRFLELFCVCRYMWYFKSESTDVLLNLDLKACLDPASGQALFDLVCFKTVEPTFIIRGIMT